MSCLVLSLPKKVCKDINSIIANYWWGNEEKERGMNWMRWKKLSETKVKGGLGFRDIQHFNVALLAKQLWRLITQPNLLVSKVFNSKYFAGSSPLAARKPKGAS
ncbi:hypothetical protein ACH5RR_014772 [Cinchona calisaya]|uniref:Reverse transcriptase n=1 Tax=Cinchona calisaya TaxID=153742 RepID=A0ABD2ZRN2_9GENT